MSRKNKGKDMQRDSLIQRFLTWYSEIDGQGAAKVRGYASQSSCMSGAATGMSLQHIAEGREGERIVFVSEVFKGVLSYCLLVWITTDIFDPLFSGKKQNSSNLFTCMYDGYVAKKEGRKGDRTGKDGR